MGAALVTYRHPNALGLCCMNCSSTEAFNRSQRGWRAAKPRRWCPTVESAARTRWWRRLFCQSPAIVSPVGIRNGSRSPDMGTRPDTEGRGGGSARLGELPVVGCRGAQWPPFAFWQWPRRTLFVSAVSRTLTEQDTIVLATSTQKRPGSRLRWNAQCGACGRVGTVNRFF